MSERVLRQTAATWALFVLAGCGSSGASNRNLVSVTQGGSGGQPSSSVGGATSAGQGGALAAAGMGASPTAGTGGVANAGEAGASSAGVAGTGLTDPGTAGDGDFTIGPSYQIDPANTLVAASVGHLVTFQMSSADSAIYPGIGGKSYTRSVWVYVPAAYVPGTPAPFIVVQDASYAVWFGSNLPHTPNPQQANLPGTANLPRILDNLIGAGKLPKLVALLVDNGGGDAGGSERGLEYDTVSGKFAEFIQQEVVPRATSEVKAQLQIDLTLTDDPEGRATLGGSSGGAASFSMAWWHPEYFRRVLSYSGTFVRQASPEDPMFPHGAWCYHDFDPYDATAPNGLIMKEPSPKPLRVWLEAGEQDLGAGSGPGSYRDFRLANQRMAASLKAKGYHYHHDDALGAGHFDGNVVAQTLPSALLWLWRGYPVN